MTKASNRPLQRRSEIPPPFPDPVKPVRDSSLQHSAAEEGTFVPVKGPAANINGYPGTADPLRGKKFVEEEGSQTPPTDKGKNFFFIPSQICYTFFVRS